MSVKDELFRAWAYLESSRDLPDAEFDRVIDRVRSGPVIAIPTFTPRPEWLDDPVFQKLNFGNLD